MSRQRFNRNLRNMLFRTLRTISALNADTQWKGCVLLRTEEEQSKILTGAQCALPLAHICYWQDTRLDAWLRMVSTRSFACALVHVTDMHTCSMCENRKCMSSMDGWKPLEAPLCQRDPLLCAPCRRILQWSA